MRSLQVGNNKTTEKQQHIKNKKWIVLYCVKPVNTSQVFPFTGDSGAFTINVWVHTEPKHAVRFTHALKISIRDNFVSLRNSCYQIYLPSDITQIAGYKHITVLIGRIIIHLQRSSHHVPTQQLTMYIVRWKSFF